VRNPGALRAVAGRAASAGGAVPLRTGIVYDEIPFRHPVGGRLPPEAPVRATHAAMYNEGMDRHGRAREEMEKAYGEVGSGAATLVVRGVTSRLREILSR